MPRRILVVEDDPILRELEVEILEDAGYVAEPADGGAAAIARFDAARPDLVLLDIVMPGINGWGVLNHMRATPNPPPTIVATGFVEVVPPAPLAAFVVGYLFKPFRGDALLKMCADVLSAPIVIPPSGTRTSARRTYVVDATLLSPAGAPLVSGRLVQISRKGFRLEITAPVQPGEPVFISFRVPGRDQPLELRGRVRWRQANAMGAQMEGLTPQDKKLLREFVDADDDEPDPTITGAEREMGTRWRSPSARPGPHRFLRHPV